MSKITTVGFYLLKLCTKYCFPDTILNGLEQTLETVQVYTEYLNKKVPFLFPQ